MPVTVDISPAVNGKAGLGRYAAALASALSAERPGQINLFANLTRSALTREEVNLPVDTPMKTIRMGYKPWRMTVWLAHMFHLGFNGLVGKTDLFHTTEHLLMPLHGIPTVLTVHDLIYHLFPQHHKRLNYWYLITAMPLFVRRADHIIAVSECTKQDLMRLYGTAANKITVVHEAAASHFKPQPPESIAEVKSRYNLPDRYLLTVGTIEPRKNLPRLVEALANLRREDPDLKLVVVGGKGWLYDDFFKAIERFGQSSSVILPGFVPDNDLPAVYAGATVTVIASLYEGFGLPVLESMASGCPVACSATSSLGEIAGDAALTFDPAQIDSILEVIRRALASADLRAMLREKGLRRAAEFSWECAARETWDVYDRVISTRTTGR